MAVDRRGRLPLLLAASDVTCRVRTWPHRPDTAQLVLLQQVRLPAVTDLESWLRILAEEGYQRVRTGALAAGAGQRLTAAGFHEIQELVLLQHDEPRQAVARYAAGADLGTRRLLVEQQPVAATVDTAAFGDEWGLDAAAIDDIRHATPRHRARAAGPLPLAAYAITGRDARQGFLQRLAVDPAHQRHGLGRTLVLDSLQWLARWRVQRVLVNTPTDNDAALRLYEGVGFRRLPERLRVFERALP